MAIAPAVALRSIRALHTVVWAVFAGAIIAIPVAVWEDRFEWFLTLTGLVLIEVAVLAFNRMRCPLTDLAARYTTDRQPNFDIYLPRWLAQYNKEVFGSLFVVGLVAGLLRWVVLP